MVQGAGEEVNCSVCGAPGRRYLNGPRCPEHPHPPSGGYPLGPRPEERERPAPEPWPAPETPGRVAVASEIPRGAQTLLKALRPPWRARAYYARGYVPDRYWRPKPEPVDMVVVRLTGPEGAEVSAAWEDGKFRYAWRWGHGKLEKLSATALRDLVRG